MPEIDPFTAELTDTTDPLSAELVAVASLDKLEEGKGIEPTLAPTELAAFKTKQAKLIDNLQVYKGYKQKRNEVPFDLEPYARARSKAKTELEASNQIIKLSEADDKTFATMVEANGDKGNYDLASSFMPEGVDYREEYVKRKAMQSFGFSVEEIDSGFAEPQVREATNAGKNEPTKDALLRWGLDVRGKHERRVKIVESAKKNTMISFMGMQDNEFEDLLNKDVTNISDDERTAIRAIYNDDRKEMETKFGHIRPMVQQAFNVIALEEGVTPKFEAPPFKAGEDMLTAFSKLKKDEFGIAVAIMAETAKAHGQDVDGTMNKMGKSLSRGVEDLFKNTARGQFSPVLKQREEMLNREIPVTVPENLLAIGVSKKDIEIRSEVEGVVGVAKIFANPNLQKPIAVSPEEKKLLLDKIQKDSMRIAYGTRLMNWRDEVAKVRGTTSSTTANAFADFWTYGTLRSLPEMGLSMTAAGIPIVAYAQKERNMDQLRVRFPDADWGKLDGAAMAAGVAYAALNRMSGKILFGKMPAVKSTMGKFFSKMGFETIEELSQDATLPITAAFYHAADEDMPDIKLFGKEGDLTNIIKSAPKTAFAMMPLVLFGMGGRKVFDYLETSQALKVLANEDMLTQYGVPQSDIIRMRSMTPEQKADFLQENHSEFTATMSDAETQTESFGNPVEKFGVTMHTNPDGNFTVTHNGKAVEARSPEEVAEVVAQLAPEVSAALDPETTSDPQILEQRNETRKAEKDTSGQAARATNALNNPNPPAVTSLGSSMFGEPLRFQMTPDNTVGATKPIGHPEVTKAVTKILQVLGSRTPVRFSGRKVSKNARGVYYLKARMIRVKKADNFTTVAHEVGHAIEDQILPGGIGDNKWMKVRNASPELARELDTLGNRLYQGRAPRNTTMSEGFAEYIRMLFEGTHNMGVEAPQTHAWFNENVLKHNPKLQKAINDVQEKSKLYAGQGAILRAKGNIAYPEGTIKKIAGDTLDALGKLSDNFVDALYPLKRIYEQAQAEFFDELQRNPKAKMNMPGENPFLTATRFSMAHDAIAKFMVEEGMVDFQGNAMGYNTSLKAILDPIKNKRHEFTIYLWAKRTIALAQDGKGRESGMSIDDAVKIYNELNSPLFEVTASKIYDWNNAVLEYAAQSSADFAEVVRKIREVDPGNYIPLFREFQAFDQAYKTRTPGAATGKLIKGLKGSTRRIKDPFTPMISQAREIILRAHQRAVLEQVLNVVEKSNIPGMGNVAFEVSPDRVPAAHRTVVDALDEITRQLDDEQAGEAAAMLKEAIEDAGEADKMLTFWSQAYNPPNNLENPIIPVYRNGKRRWYEVNRDAYNAMMSMDVFRLPKFLDFAIGMPNRMFKLGTTGYRASFSMVTNPLRDFSTLIQNSQSNASVPKVFAVWASTLGTSLAESLTGGKLFEARWSRIYKQLGLEMSTPLGADTRHTDLAAQRLFQGKVIKYVHPANILEYIRDVFQYAESATRITEMKLIAKQIGWDPKTMPLTPEIATKLAVAAKQVTANFTSAGNTMRWLNQILPFSNAQIQGVRSHIDALKANPAKFMLVGTYKAALAVTLWTQFKDEDWWKRMSMQEKYRYTYFPVGDELIRIPRAFEVDGFFMAMPVAMLDALYAENPAEALAWAKQFMRAVIPSAPVIIKTPTEMLANKDFFFDRPIIPRGEEMKYPHEDFDYLKYGPNSTTFSIKLGEIFNASPRMIDHAIRGFTGGAGLDLVSLIGRGPVGEDGVVRERQPSDIPVVGVLFQSTGKMPLAPKPITEFYDALDWANSNRSVGEETKEEEDVRAVLRHASKLLSVLSDLEKLEVKTDERRALNEMQVDIAEEALTAFKTKKVPTEKLAEWKRQAKELAPKK